MKIFIYPQHKKNQTANPYINNMEDALSKCFDIFHKEYSIHLPQPIRLLLGSSKADVYILNWIEDAAEGGGNRMLRFFITLLSIRIILIRRAKIVWIYHNIHPHNGETKWSRVIKKLLFNRSTLILSHSKEAEQYAKKYASCPVFYRSHPIKKIEFGEWNRKLHDCDFYIWGNIYPYKGVLELISNPTCKASGYRILIVGKCNDAELEKRIIRNCNERIIYENRSADFAEIAAQCRRAKYVLFPYIGDSVSSSGVLMDTLLMGGTPVGPNRGAFADLAVHGCCLTYNDIEEIFKLPITNNMIAKLDNEGVNHFMNENTWESFANWLRGRLR